MESRPEDSWMKLQSQLLVIYAAGLSGIAALIIWQRELFTLLWAFMNAKHAEMQMEPQKLDTCVCVWQHKDNTETPQDI